MYFDRYLWRLTRGLRGRITLSILVGLAAAAFGIARFTLLGTMLALIFADAGMLSIALAAFGVAAAVLLRGLLDHYRTMIAHQTAARVQTELRGPVRQAVRRPQGRPDLVGLSVRDDR